MQKSIFREYDIRGIYKTEVNETIAVLVTKALIELFQKENYKLDSKDSHDAQKSIFVVAYDGRHGGKELASCIQDEVVSSGVFDVVNIGLATTPMFYFLVNHLGADLGTMVTASHNPKEYSGIKMVRKGAVPISGKEVLGVIKKNELPEKSNLVSEIENLKNINYESLGDQYVNTYIDYLKSKITTQSNLNVVFDCSNGPTGNIIPKLWNGSSIQPIIIHENIDPEFSGHGPNPLSEGASLSAQNLIIKHKANLGVMYDADGDRAIFLDDQGEVIPAFIITIMLIEAFLRSNDLKNKENASPKFVVDELVYQSLKMTTSTEFMKNIILSKIGAVNIKNTMREHQAVFGAEYSGHYYFKEFWNSDAGILASIKLINFLTVKQTNANDQQLSSWIEQYKKHTMFVKEFKITSATHDVSDVYVKFKDKITTLDNFVKIEERDGLTFVFDKFWINLRASKTEPVVRLIGGGDRVGINKAIDLFVNFLIKNKPEHSSGFINFSTRLREYEWVKDVLHP